MRQCISLSVVVRVICYTFRLQIIFGVLVFLTVDGLCSNDNVLCVFPNSIKYYSPLISNNGNVIVYRTSHDVTYTSIDYLKNPTASYFKNSVYRILRCDLSLNEYDVVYNYQTNDPVIEYPPPGSLLPIACSQDARFIAIPLTLRGNMSLYHQPQSIYLYDSLLSTLSIESVDNNKLPLPLQCVSPLWGYNDEYLMFIGMGKLSSSSEFKMHLYKRTISNRETTEIPFITGIMLASSKNGRYVIFQGLLPNGQNTGIQHLIVFDSVNNEFQPINIPEYNGFKIDDFPRHAAISDDGNSVVVSHKVNGILQVFLYDRKNKVVSMVSSSSQGAAGNKNSGECSLKISSDGRYVSYDTLASNVVDFDINNMRDIYLYDSIKKSTSIISLKSENTLFSLGVSDTGFDMTPDARYVVFVHDKLGVVLRDIVKRRTNVMNNNEIGSMLGTVAPPKLYNYIYK